MLLQLETSYKLKMLFAWLLIVYSNQLPILNCTGFCPKHGHLHKNTTSIEMQILTRNGKQMRFYAEMQYIPFRNYTSI